MADWGGTQPYVYSTTRLTGPIAPSASAHTKGSWVAASSAFPFGGEGIWINTASLGDNTTRRTSFLDVAMESSQQILISNLMACPPHVNSTNIQRHSSQHVYFPVTLPVVTAYIRHQTSMASGPSAYVYIAPHRTGGQAVGSVVDTYGADTANTKGVTVTAPNTDGGYGSWTEITASCNRINAFLVAVGHGQADWTLISDQWMIFDVGVGSAGNEITILTVSDLGISSGSGVISQSIMGPYYKSIAPGQRISIRLSKQHASSLQRTADFVIYGIR